VFYQKAGIREVTEVERAFANKLRRDLDAADDLARRLEAEMRPFSRTGGATARPESLSSDARRCYDQHVEWGHSPASAADAVWVTAKNHLDTYLPQNRKTVELDLAAFEADMARWRKAPGEGFPLIDWEKRLRDDIDGTLDIKGRIGVR